MMAGGSENFAAHKDFKAHLGGGQTKGGRSRLVEPP